MTEATNSSIQLSTSPETKGFDLQAGESWIYPTNYPVREYQFNIIQKALLKNTLVSLPTGLGKTFIAAVIMFNYFRWYPQGKVVFMAPTRPLVKQQIDACYDIMGIPKEATAEITGTGTKISTREEIWKEKRVFFITPQILQNDLDKFDTLGVKIKCVVFDEAHKARGNHAYCEVIRKLSATNKYFRVLALSATPGGSVEDVLEVVENLLISHLEFRTEESIDVSPYVFQRDLNTVVVPLGDKLQQVKDEYMKVLEYYTRTLIRYQVVQGNCANLTKGKIFMLSKNFQQQNRGTSPNYNEIMKCLNICITLYHAAELLVRHGLRNFLTFYEEHIDKPLLRGNTAIREIMADIRDYLGPTPVIEKLPDGEYPQIPPNVKFGHPKYYKLRDILIEHFKDAPASSRVIVFFEYRESVSESYALLIQSKPAIRPRIFVGQKQGVTQRVQINVVKAFREGTCNVLLSTCIGEEGLDVGEVDLIVCFDISNKSPIRMVQRMGRTGRKKDGKIIALVTEGKEQQTLKDCLVHKNNVAFHVLGSKHLANGLQKECPRLVPEGLVPKCEKMFITVQKTVPKKSANLKDMLRSLSSKSSTPSFSPNLEITDFQERIPKGNLLCTSAKAFNETPLSNIFSKKIEKQRSFQETHSVKHSESCETLVGLLQMAESRRFNIPMSQISKHMPNKNLKQADIRNMFFKSQSAKDFDLPITQTPKIIEAPNITDDKYFGQPELFTEITNFLSISSDLNTVKKCKLCPPQVDCGKILFKNHFTFSLSWTEPDPNIYTSITTNDLNLFEKTLGNSNDVSFQFDETLNFTLPDMPKLNKTKKENTKIDLEDLIDDSILTDLWNKSANFEAPKTFDTMLNKYSTSIIDEISQKPPETPQEKPKVENIELSQITPTKTPKEKPKSLEDLIDSSILTGLCNKSVNFQAPKSFGTMLSKFSTSIIDEVVPKPPESPQEKPKITYAEKNIDISQKHPSKPPNERPKHEYSEEDIKKLLNFFKLDSLDSILEKPCITDSQETITYSPDLFDESARLQSIREKTPPSIDIKSDDSSSPILSSFGTKRKKPKIEDCGSPSLINFSRREHTSTPLTQNVFTGANRGTETPKSSSQAKVIPQNKSLQLEDLFDLSVFGLPSSKDEKDESDVTIYSCKKEDFCKDPSPKNNSEEASRKDDSFERNPVNVSGLQDFCDLDILESLKPSCDTKTSDNNKTTNSSITCRIESLDFLELSAGKQTETSQEIQNICSPSETTITQLLSAVNKPTQPSKSSQKENLINVLDDDFESFDFTFNKKTSKTQTKTQQPSKTNKLNDSFNFNNSEWDKTLQNSSSGKDSSNILNKSITPIKNSKNTKPIGSLKNSKELNSSLNSSVQSSLGSRLNDTISDDEFETRPKSPLWIKTKALTLKRNICDNNSDDDFETSVISPVFKRPKSILKSRVMERKPDSKNAGGSSGTRLQKKRLVNQFIEDEAELSICDLTNISDDECETASQNQYDPSFVADETQNIDTQMHAIYLKSVRSPKLANRFKIPTNIRRDINVFSQPVNSQDDTYLDDSFVVGDDAEESPEELSQLEILEKQLEAQRKRKRVPCGIKKPSKRKRIVCLDSDSD